MKLNQTLLMLITFLLIFNKTHGQGTYDEKNKAYTAINGITYHLKDSVQMGAGSNPDGKYNYITIGGWATIMSPSVTNTKIGAGWNGIKFNIKNIKKIKVKGQEKIYFVVGGGNITNYNLLIDDAIAACEVVPCTKPSNVQTVVADKYDQLKKLKALLDSGAISQSEFDIEKKKILE